MPTPRQEAPPAAEPWREVVALADAAAPAPKAAPETPVVKLPGEVRGDPAAWIVIVPESVTGGKVRWKLGAGLSLVPLDKLFPQQESSGIVVQGPRGQYEVWAWTAKGDVASELAVCKVVIGDAPPGPPTPPAPPTPGPTDPFTKALQAAYDADTSPAKREHKQVLVALYREAANVNQGDFETVQALFEHLRQARQKLMPDEALLGIRQAIETETKKTIPNRVGVALDAENLAKCKAAFTRTATALEGVR